MITVKEARELSMVHAKLDGTLDELLEDIEKYIKKECDSREKGLYYGVNTLKYDCRIIKQAKKILKKKGYKITEIIDSEQPNRPISITFKILWWW